MKNDCRASEFYQKLSKVTINWVKVLGDKIEILSQHIKAVFQAIK